LILPKKPGDGKVLQDKPRILIIDDFPARGWVLSRILNSNGYRANSVTYPQNGIEKRNPDLLILDLNFSEASIIRILKKIRENNPSLPIFICSNSATKQFKNKAAKWGASVFSPKAEVARSLCLEIRRPPVWVEQTLNRIGSGQMLDQTKKLSPGNKRKRFANSPRTGEVRQPSDVSREERKVTKGGEKRWQSKRTSALPA